MKLAVLSDGELTPVRRSKQNADVADGLRGQNEELLSRTSRNPKVI
jgi:hypothetical protein